MTNTIITKNSSTASSVPSSGSLTQGELAVNVTDKKLYTKNASGTVVEITPSVALSTTGNAATATALATSRTISLTGSLTGSTSFNGTANVSISASLANDSVTMDKIGSSSAAISSGRTIGVGSGGSAYGFSGTIVTSTTDSTAAGVAAVAGSTSYTSQSIVGAVCSTNSNSFGGQFVNATSTAYSTYRTYGQIGGATIAGVFNNVTSSKVGQIAPAGYAFYAQSGTYGPFTGSHDALMLKTETVVQGDIICDTGLAVNKSLVDTITQVTKSTSANQKAAVGVFNEVLLDHKPTALCESILDNTTNTYQTVIKSEYTSLVDANNFVTIASVGEGMINVCGENGDIAVGDLIVSSNTAGKGMKQADDVVRNYTVAKAREAVTFSSPSEVKQIACIYLAG